MSWKLEDLNNNKTKRAWPKLPVKLIAIILVVSLATIAGAYAIYTLTSNVISGVPLASAGAVALTVNSTQPLVGDTLTLVATVTSGLGVSGWSCQLYNNDVAVGSPVVSNGAGVAAFNQVVTEAYSFKVVATKA